MMFLMEIKFLQRLQKGFEKRQNEVTFGFLGLSKL